jgi:hypothetical protein
MRRPAAVLLLLGLVLFTCGFSLKEWRSSVYDSIKAQAENNFSGLFHRPVSIESAGGWLVGRIELNNMAVPGLGRAEKVVLTYNPLTYALAKGDMIPALTKITVINGNFSIERDRSGAFVILKAFSGGGGPAGPPPFHGRVIIQDCSAEYTDHRGYKEAPEYFSVAAQKINGNLDLRGKNLIKFSVSGRLPEFAKVQGSFDPATGKYELNVSAEKLDLKKWANYTIPLPGLRALGGTADLDLRVAPPKTTGWAAAIVGRATFFAATANIQGQKITGLAGDLFFDDDNLSAKNLSADLADMPLQVNGRLFNRLLSAEVVSRSFFGGNLAGRLALDFRQAPGLALTAQLSGINLSTLAQRVPGIEGKANGTLELRGPLNKLRGKLSARLSRSLIFGQPLDNIASSFEVVNNNFLLHYFTASSGNVTFRADGAVTPDLIFDLRAEAAGWHLKGKGLFGEMTATLNSFKGRTHWKLDKGFLAQPLRNLAASGEVALSNGRIGDQSFDGAHGGIVIGGGKIELTDIQINKDKSAVRLGGVTGFGTPTRLFAASDKIDLADLKLFDPFLPEEARGSTGTASFEVEISGELSKEAGLNSLAPLLDLTAAGRIQIASAEVAKAPITGAFLNLFWHERSLKVSATRIIMPHSRLDLDLVYHRDGSLSGSLEGTADLDHYRSLTSRFGKISGLAGFGISLSGSLECPSASASFWLQKFRFNDIFLDDISGSLAYCVNELYTIKPIIFQNGADLYSLDGNLAYNPATPETSRLDLDLKVLQSDLSSAYLLFYKIEGEVYQRLFVSSQIKPIARINLAAFRLPKISTYDLDGKLRLYHSDGDKHYYLNAYGSVNKEAEKTLAAAPAENMGGILTAEAFISGQLNDLSGRLTGRVTKGHFRDYQFDSFAAQATLKDRTVRLEKAVLSKSGGSVTAHGNINFSGALSLGLTANKMPLDILSLAFPHKEYKGVFNLSATVEGAWPNPDFTISGGGKDLSLAGVDFDGVGISLSKDRAYLHLSDFSLRKGDAASAAAGFLSLTHPGLISLEADLKGNAIGLMNLFTDQVKWNGGSSDLFLKVSGTLDDPKISGHVSVTDGSVRVTALESDLQNLRGSAEVVGGVLQINALTGTLSGKRTKDVADPFGLAGTIDLSRILTENQGLDLNLAFSPTLVYANFPNLYVGTLKVQELSLQGPLYLDGSDGPTLAGRVEVNNSVITLSQPSGGRAFPLHLALNIDLTKNAYAVMGDVATLNLSNILMNLEVGGSLRVSGLLQAPDLLGKITIRRGTVNIFNRGFSLLTPDTQKKYSIYGSQISSDNAADFRGNGSQPDLDITASVDVINQEKDSSGNPVKRKVNILAHLTGNPGVKEEAGALKVSLTSYSEDTTKSPSEFVPAGYTEQDLKVLLLPDFIKSLAGINQAQGAGSSSVDTNSVMADYLSSRVQSLLFRSLEREAEQTLGLESLTLEYNFGPQIGQALGVRNITDFEQKPAWSIGFVKGFFDRLYLEVRYAQPADQITVTTYGQSYFNYALTYKLTSIWSIIYYAEPITSLQPTGDQKVTLKAGFSLW